MVTEHVVLQIKPNQSDEFEAAMQSGKRVLESASGSSNVRLLKGHENPDRYLLLIDWESVEHHVEFTEKPAIDEFRQLIGAFIAAKPAMEHYRLVE